MLDKIDQSEIAAFCEKHCIKRLAVFGSFLRDDFFDDSDVDVLVEFEKGRAPGFGFFLMDEELSAIFHGRKIDLITRRAIRGEERRQEILETARVIYEAA